MKPFQHHLVASSGRYHTQGRNATGGGLALACLLAARTRGLPMPAGAVRSLGSSVGARGNRMPAICSALEAQKFQEQYRVILSSRSGPKQSSTAKWRFSFQR